MKVFNEYLKEAESEFMKYMNRDDRGDLEGALEHLKKTSSVLEEMVKMVSDLRKMVNIAMCYKRSRK